MKATRFILTLLVVLMSITGAWAGIFKEGNFWYEECEIDGVSGVKIISIAYCGTTLEIPQTVEHNGNVYPILVIGEEIGEQKHYETGNVIWEDDQEINEVIELDPNPYPQNISRITFATGSMVKEINSFAFGRIGSGSGSLGTITIPASVRSIGKNALSPTIHFEHLFFENGTTIEHLPAGIKAHHIHIPASVTSIDVNMLRDYAGRNNNVNDIYLASLHLMNPKLNGDWSSTHTLHVPTDLVEIYQQSRWATDYHFTIVADPRLTITDKEQYAIDVYKAAHGSANGIEAIASDYMTQIRNAATAEEALALRNQALAEIAILKRHKDALNTTYYNAPTEDGMRIRVTKKDNKVYEFNTRDMKSVRFNHVQ